MDHNETHLMMLKVIIHKIQLSVRFPCSLTFQLKLQNKIVDCRGTYELVKGSCTPQETLRLELQLQKKEDDTYRDKQVKIVIYMTSANGKIPAGSVSLNLGSWRAGSGDLLTSVIDKCPDKSANVSYTYSLDYLRSIPKNNSQSKQSGIYAKLDQSSVSSSSRVRYMAASPSYQNLRSAESKYYSKPSLEKKNSANSSSAAYQSSTYHILSRSNVPQHDTDYDQRRSRVSGFIQDDDAKKLLDSDRQKSDHIRQISKMKNEVNKKQFDDRIQTDQHYNKLREQLNQLSIQNENLRQKVRNFERRDKQLTQNIKQLKQQVERKKEKNYQQQFIRMQSQSILDEKQKLVKDMQAQLKQYEQQISDLKINISTQQKRIQFKELSLKDQLTKLGEKYQQSEAERQKAVMELNTMLEELESTEKKHQISIKEKDRAQAQQKNKLIKKSQVLTRTIQQQKDQIDQKSTLILDLQRDIKNLQNKLSEQQAESSEFKVEGRSLSSLLEKQKENNKNLQKEKQRLEQVERLFTQHKKKYQQLESQQQSTKRNLEGVNKFNLQLQNKIKQLEQQVANKSQEISSLMTKTYNLTNQIETYKKQQENYNKQAETLSMNNLNAASKIEQLRSKLDQLQMAYNELEMQSEEQISYMIKSKQYLESELEQSKWNCDKFKDSYEDMTAKSKNLSAEVLELNRRIMESQERITKLEELLVDAKSTIHVNGQQKQMQLSKEKELQEKIKEKNDQLYELNKKISKVESQNFMLIEKQKQVQKFYADKLQSQQGVNKTKQMRINEAIQNISKLQVQLLSKQETISSLQTASSRLNTENEYVKQQLKVSKKQNADLLEKINQLSEQNENLFDKINGVTQQLEREKSMKTQASSSLSKTNRQLQDYKLATSNALQQLFQEIAKDLNPNLNTTQISLISFPDEKLSTMQVEAMKKRNNLIIKYQQQIRQFTFQVKHLEEQINAAKKSHSSKEDHLESMLENQKTKMKSFQADAILEKQQLIEKMNMLEDKMFQLTAELEKLNIENEQNKQLLLEKQNLAHQLEFENNNFKNQIKALQNSLKILKQENLRIKKNYQNSLLSSNQESSVQMDKLKKSIIQNEKKISSLQKIISQKQQAISKIETNLDNMTHLKEKLDQKIAEISSRYNQLAQERKNGLQNERNHQKVIKKLEQRVASLEGEIVQANKKLQQTQIEKKKIQDSLSEEQIMRFKVVGELENKTEQLKMLEEMIKDTGDKGKKNNQKNIQEIKKLKQQIISLNSSIQLKLFEINQSQGIIKSLKITNQDLTQENANKKIQINDLQSKIQQIKNSNLLMVQELQTIKSEKGAFQDEVRVMKQTIINLESLLDENQTNLETMTLKQREITKLKQEISSKERNYQKILQDLRTQISQLKKQISNKTQRQQDSKKRIRELESQIQNNLYDSEAERKSWQENADNQRKKLIYELQGVKEENKLLAEQFQFQRQQMNHQLDQAASEIAQLKQIINDTEMQMNNSSAENTQQIQKIKSLQLQLKSCKQQWQKEKLAYVPTQKQLKQIQSQIAKYQKYAFELQKKNKQLTELAKKRLTQEPKSSSGELLREVNTILLRNKTKIISRCGERERDQVIADFKQIHEKLEGAIKSYHLLK